MALKLFRNASCIVDSPEQYSSEFKLSSIYFRINSECERNDYFVERHTGMTLKI